jgi:hypothetical protein
MTAGITLTALITQLNIGYAQVAIAAINCD